MCGDRRGNISIVKYPDIYWIFIKPNSANSYQYCNQLFLKKFLLTPNEPLRERDKPAKNKLSVCYVRKTPPFCVPRLLNHP